MFPIFYTSLLSLYSILWFVDYINFAFIFVFWKLMHHVNSSRGYLYCFRFAIWFFFFSNCRVRSKGVSGLSKLPSPIQEKVFTSPLVTHFSPRYYYTVTFTFTFSIKNRLRTHLDLTILISFSVLLLVSLDRSIPEAFFFLDWNI